MISKTEQQLDDQIAQLARVLLDEFGGPAQSESACEMAVRLLREQQTEIKRLYAGWKILGESVVEGQPWVLVAPQFIHQMLGEQ